MFLPNNTFLFKARDYLKHDNVLQNLADWLNWIKYNERGSIGKIVVCTAQPGSMLRHAWEQTKEMGLDAGFVVGARIDERVGDVFKNRYGRDEWEYESWGKEDGHHCTQSHFEIIFPSAEKKEKELELAEEQADDTAYETSAYETSEEELSEED